MYIYIHIYMLYILYIYIYYVDTSYVGRSIGYIMSYQYQEDEDLSLILMSTRPSTKAPRRRMFAGIEIPGVRGLRGHEAPRASRTAGWKSMEMRMENVYVCVYICSFYHLYLYDILLVWDDAPKFFFCMVIFTNQFQFFQTSVLENMIASSELPACSRIVFAVASGCQRC